MSELDGLVCNEELGLTLRGTKRRDTLGDAKRKIVANIDGNLLALQGQTVLHNRLYTRLATGNFKVGVKYGNRWLQDWIVYNGNVHTHIVVKHESLAHVFGVLRTQIEAGHADDEIECAMQANIDMHKKK